jgi:hypothetical protein
LAAGRKIEDESEARRCLLAAKRQGLSAGEWSRAHGIDGRSLRAWQTNLERRQGVTARARKPRARPATSALVELVPTTPGVNLARPSRYVLEVAGVRLEFGDDVSATTLRRVLEVLRSC